MLIKIDNTSRFKRDFKKSIKRGKDITKLNNIIASLFNQIPLDSRFRDHALVGNYVGYRELHIEPDWLLIYKIDSDVLILHRTGTHSDLFNK